MFYRKFFSIIKNYISFINLSVSSTGVILQLNTIYKNSYNDNNKDKYILISKE